MAALLTSVLEGSGKVAAYIAECGRLGLAVLPPTVNESQTGFTVAEGKGIRFGLLAIKNLGRGLIAELIREREENGPYRSFYSFCERLSTRREFNRRALESLVRCGALDGLGANRRQMMEAIEPFLGMLEEQNRRSLSGQMGFFDSPEDAGYGEPALPDLPEFPYAELLAMEKEITGLYITGHPLQPYAEMYGRVRAARIDQILISAEEGGGDYRDGETVTLLGMVGAVRQKTTRSNTTMAYVTLEDLYGSMELLVFPRVLSANIGLLKPGNVLLVRGRLSMREDEEPKLLADAFETAPEPGAPLPPGFTQPARRTERAENPSSPPALAEKKTTAPPGLYLRVSSKGGADYKRACLVTGIFDGPAPLYFRFRDSGKLLRAPLSMGVWPNEVMLRELRRILGEENVAMVE